MDMDWISAMPEQFPAAIVRERGKPLEIVNIPRMPLDEYDAVVRVQACSVCAATDTHLVDGEFPRAWCAEPPFVIGHESAGKVISIGPKVRHYKIGQLIVRPLWFIADPKFRPGGYGSSWGGFVMYARARDVVSESQDTGRPPDPFWLNALPVPADMPPRDATLFVTLRDARSCLQQVGVKPGDRVVVFGTGGNGFAFVRFAKLMGATVIAVGSASRLAHAKKLGAIATFDYKLGDKLAPAVREAFGNDSADVVIDAVGTPAAIPQMKQCLKSGGKMFFFGIPYDLNMPINAWGGPSKFTVETKACDEWQAHGQVLTDYLAGNFDPNDFTQATFPLEKINDAFAAIRSKEAFKVTVMMPED